MVADGEVYLGTKKSLLVLAAGREKKLLLLPSVVRYCIVVGNTSFPRIPPKFSKSCRCQLLLS
jgi:hypothetical protein